MGKTPLAWKNVVHNKLRALTSLAGVGFAILLIFMQLGFYDTCFRSSTMIYDQLEFDVALVSPQYVHLRAAGTIPRDRINQAKDVQGVKEVMPFYVGNAIWKNPQTRWQREILVLGVDPRKQPFRADKFPDLASNVSKLKRDDTALMDTKAQKAYGKFTEGTESELDNRKIEIVGTYAYGSGFISDASIIVSDRTLQKTIPTVRLEQPNVGLVKLKPGVDKKSVIEALKKEMPVDVRVLPREEVEAGEEEYFVNVKPLGLMFFSGVILAFAVGAVILYQVLASEIMNHIKEYATLKAMGYSNGYMTKIVLQQATYFALLGFFPAVLLSMGLYEVTKYSTNLPMVMTLQRIVLVMVLSVAMCGVAGVLVSRKVAKADPADLF